MAKREKERIGIWRSRAGIAQSIEHLACLISHCEGQHDSSGFRVPPMPCRYVEEMAHYHAGCQEVGRCHTRGESQGMCNTYMPPPSLNKAAHSGFETQRRCHQNSKTGVSVVPQKGLMSSKIWKKRIGIWISIDLIWSSLLLTNQNIWHQVVVQL